MTILGHGRMLYDELEKGGKTITWKKDDYEAVIEYYRTIDPKTIESIEHNYKKLQNQQRDYANHRHIIQRTENNETQNK